MYLDGKPFEITRVDDWNVELMDRSVQNPQPRLEQKDSFMRLVQQNERSGFTDTYRQYSEIKSANPDSLVLYQMGDFFEAYGADAQTVSEALELNLASRSIGGNQRIQMCGFPANHLETYVNMLLDRGFDVVVSSLENGERSTRNIVSTNKEDPVQSKPVGRIDYLHTDGTVRESVEYTSPYQLEKDIKEENYYGVPFTVVFYKDKDGNTIPQNFISELDPQPKGVEIIDSPYLANDRADEMLRQAEQIAGENTLPPDERFFVIETDDGYAIWDDLTEAIYIDDEGVSEEFKSEWQANDYLEQVKKSVSEKEAAEWLYVERAKQDTSAKPVSYTHLRADTEKHSFLIRCNPARGDYNFYCYCYVREWLDRHMEKASRGIRFITPDYKEKFKIPDGDKIRITLSDGEQLDRTCRYIDDYHLEVGSNLYHICEFAERMEQNGNTVIPLRSSLPEPVSYTHLDVYKRQVLMDMSLIPHPSILM